METGDTRTADSWPAFLFMDKSCSLYRAVVRTILTNVGLGYWQDRSVDDEPNRWFFFMIKDGRVIGAIMFFDRPGIIGILENPNPTERRISFEVTLDEIARSYGQCVGRRPSA